MPPATCFAPVAPLRWRPRLVAAPTATCARRALVAMADISKGTPGVGGKKSGPQFGAAPDRGGGVAVITRPGTKAKTARKSKTEKEPIWRVLLHNDDVHTFDYVTGAIVKVRCAWYLPLSDLPRPLARFYCCHSSC